MAGWLFFSLFCLNLLRETVNVIGELFVREFFVKDCGEGHSTLQTSLDIQRTAT